MPLNSGNWIKNLELVTDDRRCDSLNGLLRHNRDASIVLTRIDPCVQSHQTYQSKAKVYRRTIDCIDDGKINWIMMSEPTKFILMCYSTLALTNTGKTKSINVFGRNMCVLC